MAGNSVIGALRVDLGINSAQFNVGLKQAQTGLSKFGVQLTYSLNGIANQIGRLIGAFPAAVKGAIDHADALNKSAQKAGVTVEALSRLEYAAKLSDISLEGLTGGLQKLSKSMADVAMGSGPKGAFQALGIQVTDASGKLRNGAAVFGEVADRFARMQDGATKTALAIQIFGKSGAELIPLLNTGAKGLADMAAESDRLGVTISGKTAGAAEKFKDTLTRIGAVMDGITNKVMVAALPALQAFADTLMDPNVQTSVVSLANLIIRSMTAITDVVSGATKALGDLWNAFARPAGGGAAGASVDQINQQLADWRKALEWNTANGIKTGAERARNEIAALQKELTARASGGTTFGGSAFRSGWGSGAFSPPASTPPTTPPLEITLPVNGSVKALKALDIKMSESAKKAMEFTNSLRDGLTNAVTGFTDAILAGTNPLKAFADELGNIGKQLLNAGIQSLIGSLFPTTQVFKGSAFTPGGWGSSAFSGMPHFASGTMSAPAGMALVGEQGPELVRFRGGEQVIPNGAFGGQSTVRVELGPGLVGQILQQAANQSVQIVRTQAPAAVASAQRNKTMG